MEKKISDVVVNALAFMMITNSKRGLHASTTLKLYDYYDYDLSDGSKYVLTPAGEEIIKDSGLWKAYLFVKDKGYKIASSRYKPRPGNIKFIKYDIDTGKEYDCSIYRERSYKYSVYMQDATSDKWTFKKVKEF